MVIMNDMIKNLAINKSYKNEPKIHSRTERRDIGNKKNHEMSWLKQHNGDGIKRLSELEERSIKIILSEKYGEKKNNNWVRGEPQGPAEQYQKV